MDIHIFQKKMNRVIKSRISGNRMWSSSMSRMVSAPKTRAMAVPISRIVSILEKIMEKLVLGVIKIR